MLVLDRAGVEKDRLRVVVLHKLLHLGREILDRIAADGVDAHGLGEGDKVGVRHLRVRVTLVVKEVYNGERYCKDAIWRETGRKRSAPCHCKTMPWNSLFKMRTCIIRRALAERSQRYR